MTKNDLSLCRKGLLDKIVDAESASFVQDLYVRLQSAAGTMESVLQEGTSIYDELEQAANAEDIVPITVQISSKAVAAKDEMLVLAEMIHEVVLEKAKALENSGIIWHAEGEPLEMQTEDGWIPCWHVQTDDGLATVCLEYYGGPRVEVPASSLRRPREQS